MPNYIPEFSGYSGQGAFRYWCQKVLPLVYDDSLSYYELLNKIVVYLNNTIEDVAKAEGNIDSLLAAYTQLQTFVNDYFDNLDVQEQINTKLDAMAESGELSDLLEPLISSLVTGWLTENVIIPEGGAVTLDPTLTSLVQAAPAKIVGDKILQNKKNIDIKLNGYEYLVEQTAVEMHNGELWNSTLNSAAEVASGAYYKYEIEEGYYKCETMVYNSAFYRPYAIYGENGLILKEEDSVAQNERKEFSFYAPEGSEYIYINCRPALPPFLYKVEYDSNSNLLYGDMTVEKTVTDIIITLGDNELRIGKRGNNLLPDLKLLQYGNEILINNTSEGNGGTDWLPPYNIISENATSQIYPASHTATTGGNHPFEYPAGVNNATAKNVSFKCYANGKEVTDKIGNVSKLEIEIINDVMAGNTLNVPEQNVYPEGTFYLREYYLLTITPCFEIDVLHYFVPNYDGEIIWRSVLQIANLATMTAIGNYKIYIDKYTDRPLNLNEIVAYAVSNKPKKVFIENNKYLEILELEQDFGVLDKVTFANIQSGSSTNKLYAMFINSYGSTPAIFKTNRYNIYANNKYWFHGKYRFIKK